VKQVELGILHRRQGIQNTDQEEERPAMVPDWTGPFTAPSFVSVVTDPRPFITQIRRMASLDLSHAVRVTVFKAIPLTLISCHCMQP
jgi:hypothetical protein